MAATRGGRRARSPTTTVFAINLPMGRTQLGILVLPEEHRWRWGLETDYRQTTEIRPWTTSRSVTFRTILFFAPSFMHNVWAVERARRQTDPSEATIKAMAYAGALAVACNIIERPLDLGVPS